jgi:F0F1-type ATP synthase epsilon subunit
MKPITKIALLEKKSRILEGILEWHKKKLSLMACEVKSLEKVARINERLENDEKIEKLEKRIDEMENNKCENIKFRRELYGTK